MVLQSFQRLGHLSTNHVPPTTPSFPLVAKSYYFLIWCLAPLCRHHCRSCPTVNIFGFIARCLLFQTTILNNLGFLLGFQDYGYHPSESITDNVTLFRAWVWKSQKDMQSLFVPQILLSGNVGPLLFGVTLSMSLRISDIKNIWISLYCILSVLSHFVPSVHKNHGFIPPSICKWQGNLGCQFPDDQIDYILHFTHTSCMSNKFQDSSPDGSVPVRLHRKYPWIECMDISRFKELLQYYPRESP